MNTRLHNQEADPRIRKLRELLGTVAAPAVDDARLNAIGCKVFAELDKRRTRAAIRPAFIQLEDLLAFCRPAAGIVFVSAALVVIGVGLAFYSRIGFTRPLAAACVVRIEGSGCQSATAAVGAEGAGPWEPATLLSRVGQGQLYRTGEKSIMTIQLEPGTGLQLFGNSRLNIIRADTRSFIAFLERGSILIKAGKRERGQAFKIVTPNALCEITGTIFKVNVFSRPEDSSVTTELSVIEGSVRFSERQPQGKQVLVASGAQASVHGRLLGPAAPFDADREIAARLQTLTPILQAKRSAGWGAVQVTSDPAGANVFLNDVWEGVTPMTVVKPQGSYRLTVSYLNYQCVDTAFTVSAETEAALRVVLPELPASSPIKPPQRPRTDKAVRRVQRKTPAAADQPLVQIERAAIESSPEYLSAQAAMAAGRYPDAAATLLMLKDRGALAESDRLAILTQLHICYKRMGNYTGVVAVLEEMYEATGSTVRKGNILWELANVKADRIEDYAGAEMDLVEYLVTQPRGVWLYEAYSRLAEIQYVLGKFKAAAKTYATLISEFGDEPDIDRAIYALAHVQRQDLDDCEGAIRWYTMLLKKHATSAYAEDAIFWRAECLLRLGRIQEAREEYSSYASRYSSGRWKGVVRERMAGFGN